MALESAEGIEYKDLKLIKVRFQELDPLGNGRPYEEDLTESGLHADSIADLPIPGDFLGMWVSQMVSGTNNNPKFKKKGSIYKVLTRFFDMQFFEGKNTILCNIVLQEETDMQLRGRLVKD